jgi:hypothetical protein
MMFPFLPLFPNFVLLPHLIHLPWLLKFIIANHPHCFHDGDQCLPSYLTVFAILKNETPYLAEWLEYHLLVGVDRFWLINNDSQDNPVDVLQPYISAGVVHYDSMGGRGKQLRIYNSLLPMLRNETFWLAVIDIDEFLVPLVSRSVPAILRELECFPGIAVNWVVYGTNGKLVKEPGLVIERFRNHTSWDHHANLHTKAIANPRRTKGLWIHDHIYFDDGRSHDVFGRRNDRFMFHRPPVHAILWINHYWAKSVEEFRAKRLRGNASKRSASWAAMEIGRIAEDLAERKDTVTNDTAIDWAIPLVKENLAARTSGRNRLHVAPRAGASVRRSTNCSRLPWVP